MPVIIEKVKTDTFEMKYFKFGNGAKTAVILPGLGIKSVTSAAESVASAYKSMDDDFTVYVFDRRTECPQGYSIKDMANDTAEAIKRLGLRDVYLFGVSQGGMIAQALTLDYPQLVRKAVFCSTIARITEDNSEILRKWALFAEQGDEESLTESMVNTVFSDEFAEKYGDFLKQVMGGASKEEIERFIILAKGCEGFDVYDRLPEIKCPALVIGSKADKIFNFKYINELAERLNAQMIVYESYGHAVYDETPDCLKNIIEFFNS